MTKEEFYKWMDDVDHDESLLEPDDSRYIPGPCGLWRDWFTNIDKIKAFYGKNCII